MASSADKGAVVISIDFEMRWGVHDLYGLDMEPYRENIENVRQVVPDTLTMLDERGLKATWACVGALALHGWEEYFNLAPPPPKYVNSSLAVKHEYARLDPLGRLHFAPDLVRRIIETKGQELGSHTFSHLYFREPGVTAADFMADIEAVEKLWRDRFGLVPTSLVFPRNQSAFENLMTNTSIRTWRGPEAAWFHNCSEQNNNTLLPRLLRLVDSINPWIRRAAPVVNRMTKASLFVRFNLPDTLWRLHIKRIAGELRGIPPGSVFHIWWHPHNLGQKMPLRLARLEQILDLVSEACVRRGIVSKTMQDCVEP
jgi:peptidoglycan/xylan/chitin deacetylase (PgdA/CDA1 family)